MEKYCENGGHTQKIYNKTQSNSVVLLMSVCACVSVCTETSTGLSVIMCVNVVVCVSVC